MAGWHHWLEVRESQWTPGVGDGQGGQVCCDSWGRKESDTTDWVTELNWTETVIGFISEYRYILRSLEKASKNKWTHICLSEWKSKLLSCPTLCNPMDDIVHGILQARILVWVASTFYRQSSQTRDRTQVSHIAGRFLTSWVIREAYMYLNNEIKPGSHISKFKCAKNT